MFNDFGSYLDTSSVTPNKEMVDEDSVLDSDVSEIIVSASRDNTRDFDINVINQKDLVFFRSQSSNVVNVIKYSEFEDGMNNDASNLIESFVERNRFVAYNWINELYSKNQNAPKIIEGLLRSVAMCTPPDDFSIMMPMVRAALGSKHGEEQEAALMVIEEWRTKECFDAICNVRNFSSEWMQEYADKVKKELRQELESC